jgi:hypothetical protein
LARIRVYLFSSWCRNRNHESGTCIPSRANRCTCCIVFRLLPVWLAQEACLGNLPLLCSVCLSWHPLLLGLLHPVPQDPDQVPGGGAAQHPPFRQQQPERLPERRLVGATAGVARLATTLAATAFAPLRRLVVRRAAALRWPGPSLEGGYCFAEAWRLGGIAGAAADPLLQLSQFRRQGGELKPQLIVLLPVSLNTLLLSKDQRSDAGWSCPCSCCAAPSARCCISSHWL